MRTLLLFFALLSFNDITYAKLGSRGYNLIAYAQNDHLILRTCPNHLEQPSVNCDQVNENGDPVALPIALDADQFKTALFNASVKTPLSAQEIERYLGKGGLTNINSDLKFYEDYVQKTKINSKERASAIVTLERVQAISNDFESHNDLIEDIRKDDQEVLPYSDDRIAKMLQPFRSLKKQLLVYDALSRSWWAYLGRGDYFDATGNRRAEINGRETLDQRNLGGCHKRWKNSRMATEGQVRNIYQQPTLYRKILDVFEVGDLSDVWTSSGVVLYRDGTRGVPFKTSFYTILCVVNELP